MPAPPTILSLDEDKAHQAPIARAFNEAGLLLRFVSEPQKVVAGLERLSPDLLLIHAELKSGLLEGVLDRIRAAGAQRQVPIALLCDDTTEAPFVRGLRGGVVELLQKPFAPALHLPAVRALLESLPTRPGFVTGHADAPTLKSLVDHLRRTRRSGVLTLDARTPTEASIAFVGGTPPPTGSRAETLSQVLSRPRAEWSFREILGAEGEGRGVLIELDTAEAEEVDLDIEIEEVEPASLPPQAVAEGTERLPLLLVDDDPTLCKMFSTLFEKRGFAVVTASDGFEGYQRARSGEVELVVADLNMPRMDGWGLLRLLRDDFVTRELPVAFLSCHDDYREALRALSSGAQAYFSKGTRLEALVTQVRELAAPRAEVRRLLGSKSNVPFDSGAVGAQWMLRALARAGASGTLSAQDKWARYSLVFVEGGLRHASAQAGPSQAEGETVVQAFLSARGATGEFVPGPFQGNATVGSALDQVLARACASLNHNEQRLRDGLMVSANEIHVDRTLYSLYQQVGPPEWVAGAKLICDEGLSPRDLLARAEMSPLEVEEIFKDLLRRGVITLRA